MLSNTTPLKEIDQNYIADSSTPFVDESSTDFKLRHYVTDPTEYTLLTTLPTAEALDQLKCLVRDSQQHIFNALKQIYSHVTERTPSEGSAHFFIHVAATVYYEEHTGINIKNKTHYKKAASLVKMLENSIEENKKYHLRMAHTQEQKSIINRFNKILEAHMNATNRALSIISDEKKKHLEEHQNQKINSLPLPMLLSPQKTAAVQSSHPNIKFDKTPKRLCKEDKKSIKAIYNGILNSNESSDEEYETEQAIIFTEKNPVKNSPFSGPFFPTSIMDELDEIDNQYKNSTFNDSYSEETQNNSTSDSDSESLFMSTPRYKRK